MAESTIPAPVRARLHKALEGDVHTDALWRGIYARDASIYEVEPLAVVVPRNVEDVRRTLEIAEDAGLPVLPRGAGTSQAGQTVNRALVLDTSVHLRGIIDVDVQGRRVRVEPGVVLDELNRRLRPLGLFYPVDVATSSRATLGGMVGNDSAGARSIKYGTTADNVNRIRALLADGTEGWLDARGTPAIVDGAASVDRIRKELVRIRLREAAELVARIPSVPRHVAGYGLHRFSVTGDNPGQLLIGSEGTLGFFTELDLPLRPLPAVRVLGVCAFGSVHDALKAVPGIVRMAPSAVELIDRVILENASEVPELRERVSRFAPGRPGALLVVEFESADEAAARSELGALGELIGTLPERGSLVPVVEAALQDDVWTVRKTGLNLSMRTGGSRVRIAFIEDCVVPVGRLADFHVRMEDVFHRHGVDSVFYAHASVGLLHIRPGLDLANRLDRGRLRAISAEAAEIVRDLGGSFSGEHGDGIVRAEAIESMLGARLTESFREIKRVFDPHGRFNPGRIVDAPAMDDPALLHAARVESPLPVATALDWGERGLLGVASACNQNGTCRKVSPGVMCPSYRVTSDERHATRGRANALRLALTGRLGPAGLADERLHEALDLCVGCKACRRECPMEIDMSRLKIEALYQRRRSGSRPGVRERLFAHLPRIASAFGPLFPLAARGPASLGDLGDRLLGIAPKRSLPQPSARPFRDDEVDDVAPVDRPEAALFVDTFTRWFEPENARAAVRVLRAAGYHVSVVRQTHGRRPLCCGRTYLSGGWVSEASAEVRRLVRALEPAVARGAKVVGLEPSCLLTLRDEAQALVPERDLGRVAEASVTLTELLAEEGSHGPAAYAPLPGGPRVLVHGHCHEKAFGADGSVFRALARVPGLDVEPIGGGCCGMAGSFGFEREHFEISEAMAELDLLPALRGADPATVIVANGTSCRHQIRDLGGREAHHAVRLLDRSLSTRRTSE